MIYKSWVTIDWIFIRINFYSINIIITYKNKFALISSSLELYELGSNLKLNLFFVNMNESIWNMEHSMNEIKKKNK